MLHPDLAYILTHIHSTSYAKKSKASSVITFRRNTEVWFSLSEKKKSELKFFGRAYYGIRKKNYIEIYGALVDRKSEICLQDNAAPLKSVQSGKLHS